MWSSASATSRTGPLDFSEDKRGRCVDLLDSLLGDECFDSQIHFSLDPKVWGYDGGGPSSPPKELIASRLAMPAEAAVFNLDSWLSGETSDKWNFPERNVDPTERIPRGYFRVSMRE